MRPHPLARRYTKALFLLAEEHQSVDSILKELEEFDALLNENSELHNYFLSPEVGVKQKTLLLKDLFESKTSPLFYNFLLVLVSKRREGYLSEMVFEFNRLYDVKAHRIRAQVTTAVELDEPKQLQIRKLLAESFQAEILLENTVDASILGGMIVQVGGRVVDSSLARQLNRLTAELRQAKTSMSQEELSG